MLRFANPLFLLLLLAVPLIVFLDVRFGRSRRVAVSYPDVAAVRAAAGRTFVWRRWLGLALRCAVIVLAVFALARPQTGAGSESVLTEGIDIMLAVDVSGSMLTEDFQPQNRLNVAKEVVDDFIAGRVSDRIGMVVFGAQSFTQCPLTLDYNVLRELLASVEVGMIDESSTAIGLAIATATNRLRESDADSRIIILLTDGRNNAGEIDPLTAAQAAKALGLKVYTIGAGTPEGGRIPIDDPVWGKRYVHADTDIDEGLLQEIADLTGGLYFRARTEGMLADVYEQISELEKTKIEVKHYTTYTERAPMLMTAALVLLLVELLARAIFVRRLP